MVEPTFEDVFPGLRGQPYQITSPSDGRYNCIAFAAMEIPSMTARSEAAILSRVIEPDKPELPAQVARVVLQWQF